MGLSPDRWISVSESEFAWERDALAWLREHLPDGPGWRVWSNFEFIGEDGSINEVDALILSPAGLFLVEIKSRPGVLSGDARTWTWTTDGRRYTYDNPIYLADKKSKRLKSLLRHQDAFRKSKLTPPFITPLIFLSAKQLEIRLNGPVAKRAFGRGRGGQTGIVQALQGETDFSGPRAGGLDRRVISALLRAMEQAGIRPSHRHRRVGDYELECLLREGEAYQDWQAVHASLTDVRRRIRIYTHGTADTEEDRRALVRAAQREFQILQGVEHPGVLRVLEYKESDRGPALVFDHDPDAERFDFYLQEHFSRLADELRLSFLRQLAEALRYAHGKRLYHRALSPESILVRNPGSSRPTLQIFNWRLAARKPNTETTTNGLPTGTVHIERYTDDLSPGYIAPEVWTRPDGVGAHLDVFSLGAIAFHLFAGKPPATTLFELTEALKAGPGLQITSVVDTSSVELQYLIQEATDPDVSRRTSTLDAFLETLNEVEDSLTAPPTDETISPFDAKAGDLIDGGFRVVERTGSGSSSIVLLVEADGDEADRVLKISRDEAHDSRLKAEASALRDLRHSNIVRLYDVTAIGGRTALLMERAGERTLARRLRDDGRPSLDLVERWGEDLLSAVAFLEDQGVSHRDIKPDNIGIGTVGQRGRLRLILFDFSLASTPAENIYSGTRPYLDPFLTHRKPRRWDLYAERYAAAMTLYEMATGMLPVWGDGKSDPALIDDEVTIDRGLFDPHVREPLTAFFEKALRRDPRERFDNGEEMLRAWRQLFETSREAPTEAADAFEQKVRDLVPTSPVSDLGYSQSALSVLEGMGISTVRQLLDVDRVRFRYLSSVADKTRKEVRLTAKRLAEQRPDLAPGGGIGTASTSEGSDARNDIDYLAERLLPRKGDPKKHSECRAVTAFLGLSELPDEEPFDWPNAGEAAKRARVTRRQLADMLAEQRVKWAASKGLREVRYTIAAWLESHGGAMAPRELCRLLLTARGSTAGEPARTQRAGAVLRAAIETEASTDAPRFGGYGDGTVSVIAIDEARATYAVALAAEAERLAQIDPLPSPQRVHEDLSLVTLPEGVEPIIPPRRLRLATAISNTAALSTREEIYPIGMSALRAIRLCLGSLSGPRFLPVAQVKERVSGRYPEAEPLPDRPALDDLLREASSDLEWNPNADENRGAYVSRSQAHAPSGSSGTLARLDTTLERDEVSPAAMNALRFEDRLTHRLKEGGFFVITVHPKYATRAEAEIRERFDVTPLSLDQIIISALRRTADDLGVDWKVVLQADARGRTGADWGRLRQLAQRAWPTIESDIRSAGDHILLLYPGLLARYDLIQELARFAATAGSQASTGPKALWLLTPMEAHGMPMIDGSPVPVIGEAEWARVPDPWLQNLHRGRAA